MKSVAGVYDAGGANNAGLTEASDNRAGQGVHGGPNAARLVATASCHYQLRQSVTIVLG